MKTECVDPSYDIKSEIKVENTTPEPISFPMVKTEDDERNLGDQHVTGIKEEYEDQTQDLTTEIKFEDDPVPISFPVLKHEPEDSDFNEEPMVEVTTEDNEVFSESWRPESRFRLPRSAAMATNLYLNANSFHHKAQRMGILNTLVFISDPEQLDTEFQHLKLTLQQNGYLAKDITASLNRARHKKQQQQPITDSLEAEKPATACLPFTGKLSGKISRLLHKHGIKTIHKPPPKTGTSGGTRNLNRDSGLQLSAHGHRLLNFSPPGRRAVISGNSSAEPTVRPKVIQPESTKQDDTSAMFSPRSALITANRGTAPRLTPSGTIN
ncbi:hypothetical protein ANN_27482 [Periplaneta americana]|uniref:Helix-turn-helix domain-containing protein n=1 Tax=Periplaneta americana TaxID=6978 RepID=A0ABQ8RW11_PERAM|nr:hypothetical protein ANN_27482 [Periplaneta americana]